ncbi:putative MFS family arabinose efflux permease [Glaciihabitans tibetensis]|uniref:Putative MFS family arabinose efflux permease n=1 Tax=Glaciihabitans tibetensis TaxID=1266600 RepID=A0A2T0VEJ1_9MICO|nr:MFS transporter [Glaciihabitans tibetensis]PRY68584.1 putative MFS family arabinose efflux permease [Glaciihabitans tibetensis]
MPPLSFLRKKSGVTSTQPLPRDVVVLGVVAFFVMVGFGVVVPVLPVYVRSFGVGYLEVGAVVSAFAVMRLVANPFVGKMVDWAGERTILATGIGIVAASSALVGLADSYVQVLVLRGVGGIGSAMFTVSAMTLLLASSSASTRGRAVGFYQGGFLIGGMAGPAVGGLLATISLSAPFFFYAITLAVAGAVGLVMLQGKKQAVRDAAAPVIPLRSVLGDRRFQAACVANLAQGWAALGVRGALIPVLVVESLNREPAWTGIAFAVAAVAQALALGPAGRFVDTIGRRPAIIGSFAAGAVIMVLIPFVTSITLLIVLLSLYGVAAAFMGTAPAASVGDAAGSRGGMPVAVFQGFADVGAIAGPLVAGLLVDAFSFPVAFASAGVLMVVAALVAVRMPPEGSTRR